MKTLSLLLLCPSLVFASDKTLTCSMQGLTENITFTVADKPNSMPLVDFPYEVEPTIFSMRQGNLLLVAVDSEDKSRSRLFISAQWNKQTDSYHGQFFADFGGNQLQFENGRIECK
ncbi:hypothetical protein Lqui_2763 [Legionella quinlivanii]|uniref:C-type lysozyme inhibitor domain-containing protein n=1 Tax=Legionella quinlivanii TaxID=45073 RepID=A0A0W0XL53_9GAMM|nr:hypothetical protein [Legionella quinlivanii]KTD45292.1 hypothetical protein Lqui_2763 [Legionella quinlivanii]MCW8450414.1 hypothetical protein [Legionella quinlivanii]SEG02621.1 hypothetical protein SAMN02746093_01662 [Legionella quinlivanii DSM 21216]STY11408.1 Uncharacterised protein [Legionella quinlivanii]